MAPSQRSRPNALVTTPAAERPLDVKDIEIARRAYELYEQRGCTHGHDIDDWLLAERDLGLARRTTAA
jgi:hypothetical protein